MFLQSHILMYTCIRIGLFTFYERNQYFLQDRKCFENLKMHFFLEICEKNRPNNNLIFCFLFFSYLYQIAHLGDDDDEPEFSSAMPLEEGDTFFFAPRPLRNLVLVDEMDSLSPIMACQVTYPC